MMKPISTRMPGALDLATAAALLTVPKALGWSRPTRRLLAGAGAGALAYSLLTKYEFGLVKLLPMPAHLALDAISGAALCASPLALPDEDAAVKAALVAIGLFEVAAAFLTQAEPAPQPSWSAQYKRGIARLERATAR